MFDSSKKLKRHQKSIVHAQTDNEADEAYQMKFDQVDREDENQLLENIITAIPVIKLPLIRVYDYF